jgi:hypothetical protein
MNHSIKKFIRIGTLTLIAAGSVGALAQTQGYRLTCQSIGSNPFEPLGDREGHSVHVSQFTCRTEGSVLDGAVLTGHTTWEYDKSQGAVLVGGGVLRKPGATTVYQITDAKATLNMVDGRPTGVNGSGRGNYPMAVGTAAALKGKTFSFTFGTTAPGQFTIDVKID